MEYSDLIHSACADERWARPAQQVLQNPEALQQVVETEADRLICQMQAGVFAVSDLRAGVVWANALDRESVRRYAADITAGEQLQERMARRIMHHAGKLALKPVRNKFGAYLLIDGRNKAVI